MIDLLSDSDSEIGSKTINSSQSSMSGGSCDCSSSVLRLSFDAATAPAADHRPCSPFGLATKPHHSSDPTWAGFRSWLPSRLGPRDFKLVCWIGSGDIGTVYLCRVREEWRCPEAVPACEYAMKVVDKLVLPNKNKLERAATEKRILRVLDHPFLPTL